MKVLVSISPHDYFRIEKIYITFSLYVNIKRITMFCKNEFSPTRKSAYIVYYFSISVRIVFFLFP